MISVICYIAITIMLPNGLYPKYVIKSVDVRGVLLFEDEDTYLVNFSKEAKEKGYYGEHLEMHRVQKVMCRVVQ